MLQSTLKILLFLSDITVPYLDLARRLCTVKLQPEGFAMGGGRTPMAFSYYFFICGEIKGIVVKTYFLIGQQFGFLE